MTKHKKGLFSFPSWAQWKQFPKVFNKREKIILGLLIFVAMISSTFLVFQYQQSNTVIQPTAGGTLREGIIGQAHFLNPIYSSLNDPDRDIVELIFSGLMKYGANGEIIPDLTQSYEIKEDGRIYEFTLKDNLYWHDHVALTSDDILFTIETIQNPDYKSPLQASWFNVKVEKISSQKIRFILTIPYPNFLETMTTKIIPLHVWKDISARSFPLAISSTQLLVGSGPFQFKDIQLSNNRQTINSLNLEANPRYLPSKPLISQISFRFFDNKSDLIEAVQRGEIDSFLINDFQNIDKIPAGFSSKIMEMPRYFAVFLNPNRSNLLTQTEIREALNYATNREEIVEDILKGYGQVVYSPILPNFYNFAEPEKDYSYQPEKAKEIFNRLGFELSDQSQFREKTIISESDSIFKSNLQQGSQGQEVRELQKCLAQFPLLYPGGKETGHFGPETKKGVINFQEKYSSDILEPWGFSRGTGMVGKTTREKLNEICFPQSENTQPLKITLTTIDQPELIEVARLLKKQWEEVGIKTEIDTEPTSVLETEIINPRNYEALLFGEILGMMPDLIPFWHSSKQRQPGLNLALYQNEKADQLLEKAHQTLESEQKQKEYEEFQEILLGDAPAVFLYRPSSLYFFPSNLKGNEVTKIADPSKRFATIDQWYLRTKTIWR